MLFPLVGGTLGPGLFVLPLLFAIQVVMNVGIALAASTYVVLVPDGDNVVQWITRLLFFATPVIYPVALLPPAAKAVLQFQPLYPVFAAYQAIFGGDSPSPGLVAMSALWAGALLVIGGRALPQARARVRALSLNRSEYAQRGFHEWSNVGRTTATSGTANPGPTSWARPAPLGAPEPVAAGRAPRTGGGGWRPRAPRSWRWLLVVPVVLIALALAPTFVSGLKKTPRDRVGISYGGGPFEGVHFQRIVQPGSNLFFNGFFDDLYLYPSDQVNYIVPQQSAQAVQQAAGRSAGRAAGASRRRRGQPAPDAVVAPTRDRVQVSYQVAVYFKLNTDELRDFHEQLGLRYQAYTTDGWNNLIRDTFRQQIENALQEETRKVDVADLVGNADLLVELQDNVQTKLTQRLEDALGQQFFCAPTFRPGGDCGDPDVRDQEDRHPHVGDARRSRTCARRRSRSRPRRTRSASARRRPGRSPPSA